MKSNKFLTIESVFVFSFSVFLMGFFYDGDIIHKIVVNDAIFFHFVSLFFFIFGVLFFKKSPFKVGKSVNNYSGVLHLPNYFFYWCYFFSILGVLVSVLQMSHSVSLSEYFSSAISGEQLSDYRASYTKSSSDGGFSGLFKMWAISSHAVVMLLFSLFYFFDFNNKDRKKIKNLMFFSLVMLTVKTLFSLDRMSFFSLLIVFVFMFFRFSLHRSFISYFVFIVLFIVLDIMSRSRLEGHGIIDFMYLYFYLGLANLQLLLDNQEVLTYGFSLLLSPFSFVLRFFAIDLNLGADYVWVWNPAQYGLGYVFLDFGYFFFVFMFFLGFFSAFASKKALNRNLYFISIFFVLTYGLASFVTVPAPRAVEYYLEILIILFIVYITRLSSSFESR